MPGVPVIAALVALFAQASSNSASTLRTATTELAIDARGRLTSLRDRRSGRELLSPAAAPSLFLLELERDGRAVTLSASDATDVAVNVAPGQATIVYRNLRDTGVEVICTVRSVPNEPLPQWRLSASLPDHCTLTTVHFPLIVLAPRTDGRDAWVSGATKGGLYPRPSAWAAGRSHVASQPGSLAAAFACYYDSRGGATTEARDARGYPKAVGIGRTPDGLAVQWIQSCRATGRWDLGYDVALGAFAGPAGRSSDWRDAADLYKRWALTQPWCRRTLARRTDLPAWLKHGPAMVRFHRGWLADPAAIDRWMTAYWKPNFGSPPLIAAYWGWEKVETWVTPDYFPVFPSDRAFRTLDARTRKLGAHTFLWPSGYHYTLTYGRTADGSFRWDDRERFDTIARPHAVVGRDGKALIGDRSWLDGGQTATLCPGDPWTRRWFDSLSEGCARRGAELVQVDQVVGGAFPACWSTTHGHPAGPGPWMSDVFHAQLTSMLASCRRAQPGAVVCFEEPNELFLQQVGLQDYRDREVLVQGDTEPASVFNYLYHEYVPTFQSNPRAGSLLQAAWCLVTGQMPHLVPSMQVGPGPALSNGALEEWTGSVPSGWDKVGGWQGQVWTGSCARDAAVKHGGRAALRLSNTDQGQTVQVSQNVPIGGGFRVGGRYRLRLWMKSGGTTPGGSLMCGTFAEGLKATWSGGMAIPAEAGDWSPSQVEFIVPAGTTMLRIMLHLTGPGTLWLDDLRLETIRPDGAAVETPRPELPGDHAFMRAWVDLYHGTGRPYLQMGRTLHPPPLECAEVGSEGWRRPAILHNAYQAQDGSQAVVLVNATDTAHSGTLRWAGKSIPLAMKPWQARLLRNPAPIHPSASSAVKR